MMNGLGGHGWGMALGWIIGLGVVVAIIWVFVKALRQDNDTKQSQKQTPLEILKERYARGEIDKEEFEERKRNLM